MPDPVDHPDQWIKTEMGRLGRHPHWWKGIWAIKNYPLGRSTIGNYLSKPKTLYFSQWQAAVFRLPLTQQEASCWWDSPTSFSRLCTHDLLPHTAASRMRDFQTMRQEKTLALAWALQCCAERSGAPTRVLCNVAWELQKCMVPLMSLNGDDVVKAMFLQPMGDKPRTSPALEEEAALLREELELPGAPEATAFLQKCPDSPESREIPKKIDAPRAPASSTWADLCPK